MRETLPLGAHAIYDRVVSRRLQVFYDRIAAMQPPGDILDVGCGPGHLAAALAKRGGLVVAVDLDPAQVRRASRHHPDVDYRVGDAHALPFDAALFDRVLTTESFHHWRDPLQGLAEMHRVLVPGGEAWIVEGCGDMSRQEFEAWSGIRPFPGLMLVSRYIFSRHGFLPRAIEEDVTPLLEASPFASFTIERLDGWWIIRLQKAPRRGLSE